VTDDLAHLRSALAGRYAVVRAIGAGGMAKVFLADDLKHARKVALKVLHQDVATALGAERFLAEIRTTAALQHPNILPLYDSGEANGLLYYVMPLVEGESLRDKLTRERQLPVEQAVEITRTVAGALEYAHGRGIIHRDIKPENILLQHGQALVSDFGIALAMTAIGGDRMTETGIALGTAYYMSPEQALGEATLDPRADVYALGATLYEMLAGRPPFSAATQQGLIGKIVAEAAPSVGVDRPTVPRNVEAAVRTALEKLPADRFASAQAFADALVNPAFGVDRTATYEVPRVSWKERIAVPAVAIALFAGVAAGWALLRTPATPPGQVLRYRLSLPPQQSLTTRYASRVAISPDGSRLVYMGPSTQGVQLWVRRRDQLSGVPIPGTVGAAAPFFSPDGSQVGFLNVGRRSLQAVALDGGAVTTLVDSLVMRVGAAWSREGILYVDERRGLMRLPPGGTPSDAIVVADSLVVRDPKWPQFLPDGKGVLFTRSVRGTGNEFEIAALATGATTPQTVARGLVALPAGTDALVYVTSQGQLQVVRFDPGRLEVSGDPQTIADDLEIQVDAVDVALSARGTLIYGTRSAVQDRSELVWTDRSGTARVLDRSWHGDFQSVDISPEGGRLAVTMISGGQRMDVWTKPVEGGTPARLTLGNDRSFRAIWNPDGNRVGYLVERADSRRFYERPADGSGEERLGLTREANQARWSSDGQWLVFRTGRVDALDIFAQHLAPDSIVITVAASPTANEHSPALSADGRWVAYVSDKSGSMEVYVRPFPNTAAGEWQVSDSGGTEPQWAHSGREVFYKQGGRLMAAEIRAATSSFAVGQRRALFSVEEYYNFVYHPTYAVAKDDQHFAMIRSRHFGESFDLVVIENWSPPRGN